MHARTVHGVRAYGSWLEEVHLSGAGHRLGAAARPQLAVEAVDVGLDGARRDEELARNLSIGVARCDEREHLQLSLAQWLGKSLFRACRRGVLRAQLAYLKPRLVLLFTESRKLSFSQYRLSETGSRHTQFSETQTA